MDGIGGPMDGMGGPMDGIGGPMDGMGGPMDGMGGPMDGMGGPMDGIGGPMDGIGGAVKNTVFRKVLSGEAKIASPEEFDKYANDLCEVHSLYLPTDEIPAEPEEVENATAIPDTLKTHCIIIINLIAVVVWL